MAPPIDNGLHPFSPLMITALDNNRAAAAILLDHQARVNLSCEGVTALTCAAHNLNFPMARFLVSRGATARDCAETAIRHVFVRADGVVDSRLEIQQSAETDRAIQDMVAFLLDHGAPPSHLATAANLGLPLTTRLLLAREGDPAHVTQALDAMVFNPNGGHDDYPRGTEWPSLFIEIARRGRGECVSPKKLGTALCWIARDGEIRVKEARALLAMGADPNVVVNGGETALSLTVQHTDREPIAMVRLLLQHGIHVNTRDRTGNTPLKTAEYMGYRTVVQMLKAAGAHQ